MLTSGGGGVGSGPIEWKIATTRESGHLNGVKILAEK